MSLAFPEVAEEIIDFIHEFGNVGSLRNLALTSRLFLPRSRYQLLSWHICLNSIKRLHSFCDSFDAHPYRRLWVRSVTISQTKESPFFHHVVPMRLLANYPNLHQWKIVRNTSMNSPLMSSNSHILPGLRHYAQTITHLHLNNVSFQSCADLVRYILAFSGLRRLHCEWLEFKRKDNDMALIHARQRLSKQLHLSHLTIGCDVPDVLATLLLKSAHSTLEVLVFDITQYHDGPDSDIKLSTLIPSLPNLSSITLEVEMYDESSSGWRDGIVPRAVEILEALPSKPHSYITEIAVHLLDRNISKLLDYLQENPDSLLQKLPALESALLRLPRLQKIELCHYLRRPLRNWTPMRLDQCLPTLHKRGLINTRCLAPPIQGHSDVVRALAVSPDGRCIASSSRDSTIILWDTQRGTIVHEWPVHSNKAVVSLAFSPDSRHLASAGRDDTVRVWDISEEAEARVVAMFDDADLCVWQPDGMILALERMNGIVHAWNPLTNEVQLHFLEGYSLEEYSQGTIWTTIFSADGRWVAACEHSWRVWDARTGRMQISLPGISWSTSNSIAFDPAGQRIAIPLDDYSTHIWDIETGDELAVLDDYTPEFLNATFSPDGTRVLSTVWDDMAVKLWDSLSGKNLVTLLGHESEVAQVCMSPDGKYVASASYDHTVRLWNASSGSCIRTFTEHDASVGFVVFSPSGETLASGGNDGKVCIRQLCDV